MSSPNQSPEPVPPTLEHQTAKANAERTRDELIEWLAERICITARDPKGWRRFAIWRHALEEYQAIKEYERTASAEDLDID